MVSSRVSDAAVVTAMQFVSICASFNIYVTFVLMDESRRVLARLLRKRLVQAGQ